MHIVMLSYSFAPAIGGLETVALLVSEGLVARGHRVTVVTMTPAQAAADDSAYPYAVVRQPSRQQLLRVLGSADAIIESQIPLSLSWPLYLARLLPFSRLRRIPSICVLHTPILRPGVPLSRSNRLKMFLLSLRRCYAVSRYLQAAYPGPTRTLPNPYDERIFHPRPAKPDPRRLLFVGRLTAAKGCEVAIAALALLREQGHDLALDIVGRGEDEPALRAQVERLGLQDAVLFHGAHTGEALAQEFARHRVVLVPSMSRPPEAFGIVAVEAIACGCVPVVSAQGGLPEAIGDCGLSFPEGDAEALAAAVLKVVQASPQQLQAWEAARAGHLQRYRPAAVIEAYLAALTSAG